MSSLINAINAGYNTTTFTPTLVPAAGSFSSITYTNQVGEYTQIGNLVFFSFWINVATFSIGTGSGALGFNLPITASLNNNQPAIAVEISDTVTTYTGPIFLVPGAISTSVAEFFNQVSTATNHVLQASDIQAGMQIYCSGFYFSA